MNAVGPMASPVADPGGGATGANAPPFKKSEKISFKPFLKVFGPLQCFCVCHTTENDLVTGKR